jgi:hypothetical protein
MTQKERAFFSYRWQAKKKFGLTDHQIKTLKKQCEICGSTNRLHFDHDHTDSTPHVRGILCHSCNVGIGHFKEQPKLLRKAIEYLKKNPRLVS